MIITFLKNEWKRSVQYKEKIVLNWFFLLLVVMLEYSVYSSFVKQDGMELLVYLVVANVLNHCLLTNTLPRFIRSMKKGEVAKYRTFPKSMWEVVCVEDFVCCLVNLALNAWVLVFVVWWLKCSFVRIVGFVCSLALSVLLSVFVGECFYSLALPLQNHSASKALLNGVSGILSGGMIPLQNHSASKALLNGVSGILSGGMIPLRYLPKWFVSFCYVTPFAFLVDGPMRVLLEGDFVVLVYQIGWCVVLGVVSYWLFAHLACEVEIYGG